MNKVELIAAVAEKSGESKAAVERVVSSLEDVIIASVVAGNEIKLSGFAAFKPNTRAPRTMRNPATGEAVEVPETKTVKIRPLTRFSKEVKEG